MNTRTVCAAILVVSVAGCSPKSHVEVSQFKQGLMRVNADKRWEIYEQTTDIRLTPNGECEANGAKQQCTWFGVDFDYSGVAQDTALDCTVRLSEPSQLVTPDKVSAARTSEHKYKIALKAPIGHITFPGYAVVTPDTKGQQIAVACTHETNSVMRYVFNLQPEPGGS